MGDEHLVHYRFFISKACGHESEYWRSLYFKIDGRSFLDELFLGESLVLEPEDAAARYALMAETE